MAVAQAVHWQGWGGSGRLFERLGQTPFTAALREGSAISFDWYRSVEGAQEQRFSDRQRFFKRAATSLSQYAAACTAAIAWRLSKQKPTDWRVVGSAVGPRFKAEDSIAEYLRELERRAGRRPTFSFWLSEANPRCLADLLKVKPRPDFRIREIRYRDLNTSGQAAGSSKIDLADVYSCSVALHQIADGTLGTGRLRRVLQEAIKLVRPGGVISLPMVGPGVALQAYLIPVNAVDREGGVGGRLFAEGPLKSPARLKVEYGERWKVMVPLDGLEFSTPRTLAREGLSMYTYTPYVVIDLADEDLAEVETKPYPALDRWLRRHHSVSALGLQRDVRRDVEQLVPRG